jgi:hypothetical protein
VPAGSVGAYQTALNGKISDTSIIQESP